LEVIRHRLNLDRKSVLSSPSWSWIKRERQTFSTQHGLSTLAQVEKRNHSNGSFKRKDREFVEAHGFSLKALATDQTLRSLYLNTGDLLKKYWRLVKNICVCEC